MGFELQSAKDVTANSIAAFIKDAKEGKLEGRALRVEKHAKGGECVVYGKPVADDLRVGAYTLDKIVKVCDKHKVACDKEQLARSMKQVKKQEYVITISPEEQKQLKSGTHKFTPTPAKGKEKEETQAGKEKVATQAAWQEAKGTAKKLWEGAKEVAGTKFAGEAPRDLSKETTRRETMRREIIKGLIENKENLAQLDPTPTAEEAKLLKKLPFEQKQAIYKEAVESKKIEWVKTFLNAMTPEEEMRLHGNKHGAKGEVLTFLMFREQNPRMI